MIFNDETLENVEAVNGVGESNIDQEVVKGDTKKVDRPERTYTKAEVEEIKDRTAKAVEKRLTTENQEKISKLERVVYKKDALEVYKSLNGNVETFEDFLKVTDLDLSSETLKEDMTKALAKKGYFRKSNSQEVDIDTNKLKSGIDIDEWKRNTGL